MMNRCYKTDYHCYGYYGERGICVCKEWHDKWNFVKWAEDKCGTNLTIDRKDVNGNYEPSNCKWATRKEQADNKTNNINITYQGKTMNLKNWCIELGIKYTTAYRRYKAYGDENLEKIFQERRVDKNE